MPPAFQAEFDAVKLAFENKHKEFLKAEENSVLGQATKMKANNALFTDLSPMFADAQRVFTEPEIQKQFTFTELLYLASGAGTAGARGHATDTQTGSPIPNILVHTVGGTYHETTTDDSGFYEMLQLAAGETVIRFEGLPQYENKDITKTIIVGTVSTFDVELTPKPVGATGHVTDSITGLQLGNITVKTDDAHTTVSDADGLYQLLNLPLGDNIIHFIGLPSHGNKDINTTITVGTINTVDAQLNSLIP